MIVAIIPARVGSSRLPGKVLQPLIGKDTVLSYLLKNIKKCTGLDKFVVATTKNEEDSAIVTAAEKEGYDVITGSERDVLHRYRHAAEVSGAETVVRVNADNPFTLPALVDDMLNVWSALPGADYCSNILEETFPLGMHVEIITREALFRAERDASSPEDREHITPYIYSNADKFKVFSCYREMDLSSFRFTIDYKVDIEFARRLAHRIDGMIVADVRQLCETVLTTEGLFEINSHLKKAQTSGRYNMKGIERKLMR